MRILLVSAFYPPHEIGGWEQLVADVNDCLESRGHETFILTSRHGLYRPSVVGNIARILFLENDLQYYRPTALLKHRRELEWNLKQTLEVLASFKPDVAFIHGMWNLTWGVPWCIENTLPSRVVYYIASDWPYRPDIHTAYWKDPAGNILLTIGKRLIGTIPIWMAQREKRRFSLKFDHVITVSRAVAENLTKYAGLDLQQMYVIHNGVETDRFFPADRDEIKDIQSRQLNLLYAGSIAPHKGVHIAIEAMTLLNSMQDELNATLTIVGSGQSGYEQSLREKVVAAGLNDQVNFRGRIPRENMPEIMREHDVLLLPSLWDEPLSRVMLEAMSSGLVVIGTETGGTGELLVHGQTGLVFRTGDAESLANQIAVVGREPVLAAKIASRARREVIERFSLTRMIDNIEKYLLDVANNPFMTVDGYMGNHD